MPLSSSSDSDGDDDMASLNRILAKSGASAIEILNKDPDSDSDSDSSGNDVQDWFRQIQEKFSTASGDADPFPVIKPLSWKAPSEGSDDDDDEDVMETMAAIHRRFDQYQDDHLLFEATRRAPVSSAEALLSS